MAMTLARNWWTVALRGLFALIFGILAFIYPGITLAILVLLFGAYVLVDGIFACIAALRAPEGYTRWWVMLLEGVVGIVIGILTFFMPGITAFVLLYLIAAWAIITGILEISAAIRLRRQITNEWLLILSGVLSIVFGLVLIFAPGAGALAVVWIIAAYSVVFGVLLLALGFRLRGWRSAASPSPA